MSEVVEIEGRANIDVVIVENSWTLKQHQKERTEKKIRVFFVRATSWGRFCAERRWASNHLKFLF
jgi:hypothetical protein